MLAGEAVVAIWNAIEPDTREQFYDWHVNEHMPERVGIPGPGTRTQLRRWIVHIEQLARPVLGFP